MATITVNRTPAQIALRHEMERASERGWAAQWLEGIEDILWAEVADESNQTEDVRVLRWLWKQAGGWWEWSDEAHDTVFVPDD